MVKAWIAMIILFPIILPFQPAEKRKVLLFSAVTNNTTVLQQEKILNSDPSGIHDRDIVIETPPFDEHNFTLYKKYQAQKEPFLFVLIGKDGGEKFRSTSLVPVRKLFALIDRMPMRKNEMKKQ